MTNRCLRALAVVALAVSIGACGPSPTPSPALEGFPTEVLGIPVISVGDANELIASGKLDGRVAAVGGWWLETMHRNCARPPRAMAELEGYCNNSMFASRPFAASTCTEIAGGTSCHSNEPPADLAYVSPLLLRETSAGQAVSGGDWASDGTGIPMVLVGHVNDPRLWNCPVETRSDCARRFVVDRVAWAVDQPMPLASPNDRLPTRLTPDEAVALARVGAEPIVAVAIRAAEAPIIDPRLHQTGDAVLWVVRTIAGAKGVDDTDPSRAVDVSLVDDVTGQLLSSLPLAIDEEMHPAFLYVQGTSFGECCAGDVYPFYRVERTDGIQLQEGQIGGGAIGHDDFTRWGPGSPVVVDSGDYLVHAWRATFDRDGRAVALSDGCDTQVTLAEAQELRVEAAFPQSGPCTFVAPTFEDPRGP